MLAILINQPSLLTTLILLLALLNYGLALWVLRVERRQALFQRLEAADIPRSAGTRSPLKQMALPFVTAVPIAILALYLDDLERQVVCGGYLVMQLATLILNLDGLLRIRLLSRPGIAEGCVRFTGEYQHRNIASRLLAFAGFTGMVAVLFTSVPFAAGSVFLLATVVGAYRRARQVSAGSPAN